MVDYSDCFGGKFLKADDINKPFVGEIERVVGEKIDGRLKPVIYFEGREKGVVLNSTRHKFVVGLAKSKNSDDWLGLKIGVRQGTTDFGGKEVGCIEFLMPPKTAAEKTAEVKAAVGGDEVW
jgi:hypothetical protein